MRLDSVSSERIHLLRTLLIVGIVVLHIPPSVTIPSQHLYAHDSVLWLKVLTEKTFFRASVPTLSIISGFLFFLSYNPRSYLSSIKRKSQSLLIPFIIWNMPLVVVLGLLQSWGGAGHSFRIQLLPFDVGVWLNAALGITESPINFPLAFLRDIFVCVLLSPVLFWLLRHAKWLGMLMFMGMVIGLIPHDYFLLRPTILLGFYLGGWLAQSEVTLQFIDKWAWIWIGAFILACLWVGQQAMTQIYDAASQGLGQKINVLRLLGIPAFWALSGWLVKTSAGQRLVRFSPHTFFLFCAHGPMMVVSWILWHHWVGDVNSIYYVFYFLFIAPFIVTLSWLAERGLFSLCPSLHQQMTGQRRIHNSPSRGVAVQL